MHKLHTSPAQASRRRAPLPTTSRTRSPLRAHRNSIRYVWPFLSAWTLFFVQASEMFGFLAPLCSPTVLETCTPSWLSFQSYWSTSNSIKAPTCVDSSPAGHTAMLPAVCSSDCCVAHADALMIHNFILCLCINNSVSHVALACYSVSLIRTIVFPSNALHFACSST